MSDDTPKETWDDFMRITANSEWRDLRLSQKITRVFFFYPLMLFLLVVTSPLFLWEKFAPVMTTEQEKEWWKNKESALRSFVSAIHSALPFAWFIAGIVSGFGGSFETMILCFIMGEVTAMNIKMDKVDTIIHEKE